MTTETNFTPGPWVATSDNSAYPGYFIRSDSKPGYIAEIRAFTTQDEVDANKSLIAAAPDLYAALEDLRDWYSEHTGMPATAANAALASSVSFIIAAVGDGSVYQALIKRRWLIRSNASNVVAAAIDSTAFPLIAFGAFMPQIIIVQFIAKTAGGAIWSVLLCRVGVRQ